MTLIQDASEEEIIERAQDKLSEIAGRCVFCNSPIALGEWTEDSDFEDEKSLREFAISGMCQECQDGVFE